MQDIESFESGGAFHVTRRISGPPRLEDLAELTLPDEDVNDLKTCRVGNCEIKLDGRSIEKLRAALAVFAV